MSKIQPSNNLYGFTSPLSSAFKPPIVANRLPTIHDYTDIGRIWVYPAGGTAYILVSIVSNVATWDLMTPAGGAGTFTSLVVTPGPITLTGTTLINNSGAASTGIGTGTNTGVLALGNTGNAGTSIEGANITMDSAAAGTIFVGTQLLAANVSILSTVNTGAQVVSILNGNAAGNATFNVLNGVPSAGNQTVNIVGANNTRGAIINIGTGNAGHIVTIGNTNVAASVVINGGVLGGLDINTGGTVTMQSAASTAAAYAATNDFNVGYVTLTGQVLASAADQDLVITSAGITANTRALVTVSNGGANDAKLTVQRIQYAANTMTINVKNNGAQALNGDIQICFWVIQF
jgi:hypothetical protein